MERDAFSHDTFGIWSDGELADEPFAEDTIGTFAASAVGGQGGAIKRRRRLVLRRQEVDVDEEVAIMTALLELGVF